jgi:hypothetical protein
VASAALALPASSLAATVGVEELPTDPRQVNVIFAGGSGEGNRLTVSVAPVLCKVHKPTVGDFYSCWKGCYAASGTAWDLNLSFALGDAGSRLDTTALPGSVPNKSEYSPSAPIEVAVVSGAGDDTVLTGPGPDEIGPSRGADLIRTGDGRDVFRGGPVTDGPDDVDLGDPDEDTIDYSERSEDVHYDPNGLADDGAPGEGDDLGAAGTVSTGAGADTLVSISRVRRYDTPIDPIPMPLSSVAARPFSRSGGRAEKLECGARRTASRKPQPAGDWIAREPLCR